MLNNDGATLGEYRSYVNKVGNKRYYSSTDAKLFFGDEELEEIVSINWQMQEPKMPLYGYNSFTFDEVAVGSRIIQGTFIINYLIPNYLAKLVRTNAKSSSVEAEDKIHVCLDLLIENGYVYATIPPLYRITYGKDNYLYLQDDAALEQYRNDNVGKNYTVSRMKG